MIARAGKPESLLIDGTAGKLEAVLEAPAGPVSHVAVVCHPHPLYHGTMNNKVVHTVARTYLRLGAASLRFNYRGVGHSEGRYAGGDGETEDAIAAISFMKSRWPEAKTWLGGFSFGGVIAMRAAVQQETEFLVTVAPAVYRFDPAQIEIPSCKWLLIHGDSDQLVDCQKTLEWTKKLATKPEIAVFPGADHFFHGKLTDLRDTMIEQMQIMGIKS